MSGKILRISIEAFMGIKNMDLEWDQEHAIMGIIGDGGTGKTSIMKFVKACMDGIIPEESINLETQKAKGYLNFVLNGKAYTIEISKTKKSETVKIRSEQDMSGGKEVLRKIVGNVSLSPFALRRMAAGDQTEEFKKIFKIDTTALKNDRNKIFQDRRIINAQVKQLKTTLQTEGVLDDKGNVIVSFSEKMERYQEVKILEPVLDQLKEANGIKATLTQKSNELESNNQKSLQIDAFVKDINKQIKILEQRKADHLAQKELLTGQNTEIEKYIENSSTITILMDGDGEKMMVQDAVEFLEAKVTEYGDHNQVRNNIVVNVSKLQQMNDLVESSNIKSGDLDKKDKEIEGYIKSVLPPMDSISIYEPTFDEEGKPVDTREGIYWNQKPINILSTTETITFGMELQKFVNPDGLPILLFDDFESLGSLGRNAVDYMSASGWQALTAEVDPKQTDLKVILKKSVNDTEAKLLKGKSVSDSEANTTETISEKDTTVQQEKATDK